MNSKAFSRVFSPKSEKYFQNIKYFACPGIEPTPVKYRPCILPLSQAALIFICFKLTILLPQHPQAQEGECFIVQKKFFLKMFCETCFYMKINFFIHVDT